MSPNKNQSFMIPQLTPSQAEEHAKQNLKILKDLGDQFVEKKVQWLRHVLLLASTLFGVLISLHTATTDTLCTRWAFLVALASIALGILCTASTLYGFLDAAARLRKDFSEEAIAALNEYRFANAVTVSERKIFVLCEKLAYIFFLIGIFALVVYVALPVFIN